MKSAVTTSLVLCLTIMSTAGGAFAADEKAQPPIRVLLVTGQNNHNCKQTSGMLWMLMMNSGVFTADIACSPPRGADAEAMAKFQPDFAAYDMVLMDYNGQDWSRETEERFEAYVENGGGVVNVHAANNAFPRWKAWNEMIGLGWRSPDFGDRLYLDDQGKTVRVKQGEGIGAGHGPVHQWNIIIRQPGHAIMQGLPGEWAHAADESYHGQRGPAEKMTILSTAFSSKEERGSGVHEPITWEIPYGKGRVITSVMGHWWGDQAVYGENNMEALRCAGFQTIILRACEYAATGKVERVGIPEDFPTKDKVVVRK